MAPGSLAQEGAQPQRQSKYAPLFLSKSFSGLVTNRSVLHDAATSMIEEKWYGGRTDALWDGSNVELTNRLTIQRRPGLSAFSSVIYPTAPLSCFSFSLLDGTARIIVDCGPTPIYALASVDTSDSGEAKYYFGISQTLPASYVGLKFTVSGFSQGGNNGTFVCVDSTSTYLILANSNAVAEILAASVVSSGAVYYDWQTSGTSSMLFAKKEGAGQTHFVAVAGILYAGDGVDTWMYTPGVSDTNDNKGSFGIPDVWNWSGPAPSSQLTINSVASGAEAISWKALTFYTTMGLIIDDNDNIQQLYSVNANGGNPPPAVYGTSGNGTPDLPFTVSGTLTDGGVTWTNLGPITLWQSGTVYQPGAPIYDPATNCIFITTHNYAVTSGFTYPSFINTSNLSWRLTETTKAGGNTARWMCLGQVGVSPTCVLTWAKNTAFGKYIQPGSGSDPNVYNCAIVYPLIPTEANIAAYMAGTGPAIYLYGATTAGTTANRTYTPWTGIPPTGAGSQVPGSITIDANPTLSSGLEWLCLGPKAWASGAVYTAWVTPGCLFSCIEDGNGDMQACIVGGTSAGSAPTWETGYGSITTESTGVQWVCVGPPVSWAANTQWCLPTNGFSPPSSSQAFGGVEAVGAGYVQAVTISGQSGGPSAPSWSTTIGNTTSDGSVTWTTASAYSANSLAWSFGFCYAYSFYSRLADDDYNITISSGGLGPPPGLTDVLGVSTGSQTGNMTTASLIYQITGANSGSINRISGLGSEDPQFDTIIIWRSPDMASGSANMYFLTEILMPPPINGVAQPWTFNDYLPNAPQIINGISYPGLNNLIPAPIDDQNDPPNIDFRPMVFHMNRIWGISKNEVMFSGGPDVLAGNSNSAFSPSDEFEYLQNPIRVVKTSQGLAVWLPGSIEFIAGGPLTASFYPITIAPGIGLGNFNALDQHGGEITFVTVDGRLMVLTASLDAVEIGFQIADKILANITPSTAYIADLDVALDQCFFVADGATGWYRCWPRTPQLTGPGISWSPFATITGGCKMVQMVEITPGVKKLLVGAATGGHSILMRDLSTYKDGNSEYDAWFVIGSLMLCHPGQLAICKFLEFDFSPVDIEPTISFLLNEISGTFTPFTLTPQFDPPSLYGMVFSPSSYSPLRYYFPGVNAVARCRHMQVKIDFGTDNTADEMLNMTVYGRLQIEG